MEVELILQLRGRWMCMDAPCNARKIDPTRPGPEARRSDRDLPLVLDPLICETTHQIDQRGFDTREDARHREASRLFTLPNRLISEPRSI